MVAREADRTFCCRSQCFRVTLLRGFWSPHTWLCREGDALHVWQMSSWSASERWDRVRSEVFQLPRGTGCEAASEMANMQSLYSFSGGKKGKKKKKKESFLPLPDGLQQKQLERPVTCQNQSSTWNVDSLGGLGIFWCLG